MDSETGECSYKSLKNQTGRPFKKARYAWQVKGTKSLKANEEDDQEQTSQEVDTTNNDSTGRCCLKVLLDKADKILDYGNETSNIDESISDGVTTILDPFYNWQETQILKGNLDNAINSVIEQNMPLNDEDGEIQAENEGIFMAIQSHGLRPYGDYMWEEYLRDKEQELEESVPQEGDFLNAAISCAIQKKGLSSQSQT